MGAGSKFVSSEEKKRYYQDVNPLHYTREKKCEFHFLVERRDIGVCRFLNTGKPYIIEQCLECKREYVRELKW